MKVFAERLKSLRQEKGLTLQNISDAIGVSINTISRWERCERLPNILHLVALANFFKVSVNYLCGMEE